MSKSSATLPSLQEERVEASHFVEKAMKLEVEAHLNQLKHPCTLDSLAAILKSSMIMKIHQPSISNEEGMFIPGFDRLSLSSPGASRRTVNDLEKALSDIERDPKSFSTYINSWDEALAVLSKVIKFVPKDQTKQKSIDPKHLSLNEYQEILSRRIVDKFDYVADYRRASEETLLQAAETAKGVASDRDGSRNDLDERLRKAYEKQEERAQNHAVLKVEQRLVEKERKMEAQKMASSLLRPLSSDEKATVSRAINGVGPPNEVVAQVGSDSIQRESIQRLQPGQWLNDEVIHYFLVMLSKRDEQLCRQDEKRQRSHFFKSFFMTKLLNEGNADPALDGKYTYQNVKRWSKKVPGKDIFNLDKVFFPVNQGNTHWVCIVAFMQEKRIQMYDSMGAPGTSYLKAILQYFKDDHMDKKKCPLPDAGDWCLVATQRDTPHQRNGFDCGVFTCMFADFLSKDCPLVFSQKHITQCRERIALSIMNGSAIM